MIRILHVLEQGADFQTRRCVEHLLGGLGDGFGGEARAIGRGGDWRGLVAGVMGLRRTGGFGVVHAWGSLAMTAAAVGWRGRLVYSPTGEVGSRTVRWLRAAMGYREIQVIAPTASIQRALVEGGVAEERCGLIRPGVDLGRIRRRPNRELREAMGLSDRNFVLAAVGETTRTAGHRDAHWTTGILHVYEPEYRLLLWGRGENLDSVRAFDRNVNRVGMMMLAEQRLGRKVEMEELLSAADLALVTATGDVAPLPICIAMASGTPIVATVTATTAEMLEDRHNAVMMPPSSQRLMSQRILELREDRALQWKLAEQARRDVYEHFSLNRFLEGYREMYRKMAGVRLG